MWFTVQAVRQTRPDSMVEVKVSGVWHLAYTLEWAIRHTMPRPVAVGDFCKIPENSGNRG